MANIKSSAKRDVKSKELRAKNRADKTELKTMMKKFDAAVAEGNRETAVCCRRQPRDSRQCL